MSDHNNLVVDEMKVRGGLQEGVASDVRRVQRFVAFCRDTFDLFKEGAQLCHSRGLGPFGASRMHDIDKLKESKAGFPNMFANMANDLVDTRHIVGIGLRFDGSDRRKLPRPFVGCPAPGNCLPLPLGQPTLRLRHDRTLAGRSVNAAVTSSPSLATSTPQPPPSPSSPASGVSPRAPGHPHLFSVLL